MLKMVDVEFIKKKHANDGWSVRKIARQLEVSRQTVWNAPGLTEAPYLGFFRISEEGVRDP